MIPKALVYLLRGKWGGFSVATGQLILATSG